MVVYLDRVYGSFEMWEEKILLAGNPFPLLHFHPKMEMSRGGGGRGENPNRTAREEKEEEKASHITHINRKRATKCKSYKASKKKRSEYEGKRRRGF